MLFFYKKRLVPLNFSHLSTFVLSKSFKKTKINVTHKEYLCPLLFQNIENNLNDIHFDIHKSNIFSIALCFLEYATLESIEGLNNNTHSGFLRISELI